mmetsp:Transcript_7322/g.18717  ORF Transcript_7322/g.18717 Transcript_7322/m.18717 type:complete len:197 (-) Transcript_7322:140-730(-)
MSSRRSHYEVLGVARTADKKEIRRAFLRAVKIHHPDQGGQADNFLEVQKAWKVLSDVFKRQEYDESGERIDFEAREDAERQASREHKEREYVWRAKHGQGMPGGGEIAFDFDEWERAHGLGKYGNGPDSINTDYQRYYMRKEAERERTRRQAESGEINAHQAFFRRRNAERRGLATLASSPHVRLSWRLGRLLAKR